ncbi:hypothetical protein SDC9_99676 [bioreactor metagenome]|uniref:Uncharacterized protein n=1 Tax=bioreactor metagenome TaxID=1076179 RepID=A0A645AI64_9ZZZZ
MDDEGDLKGVHLFRSANSFDRGDLCPIWHTFGPGDAGKGQLAVYDDGTSPTMTLITGDFCAGQKQFLAQNISQ